MDGRRRTAGGARGVCDSPDWLRANNAILRAGERAEGRRVLRDELVAREDVGGNTLVREKGGSYSAGTTFTRCSNPLRQHVLLDYRMKLPDRRSRRTVSSSRKISFAIFIKGFERERERKWSSLLSSKTSLRGKGRKRNLFSLPSPLFASRRVPGSVIYRFVKRALPPFGLLPRG